MPSPTVALQKWLKRTHTTLYGLSKKTRERGRYVPLCTLSRIANGTHKRPSAESIAAIELATDGVISSDMWPEPRVRSTVVR